MSLFLFVCLFVSFGSSLQLVIEMQLFLRQRLTIRIKPNQSTDANSGHNQRIHEHTINVLEYIQK